MKALLLLVAAFATCHPDPLPPDGGAPPSPIVFDAAPLGPCEQAAANMSHLGCKLVAAETWVSACNNARAHGIDLHTSCRIAAASCAEVDNCDHQ